MPGDGRYVEMVFKVKTRIRKMPIGKGRTRK